MTLEGVLEEIRRQARVFGQQRCLTEFQVEQIARLAYEAGKRDMEECGCGSSRICPECDGCDCTNGEANT